MMVELRFIVQLIICLKKTMPRLEEIVRITAINRLIHDIDSDLGESIRKVFDYVKRVDSDDSILEVTFSDVQIRFPHINRDIQNTVLFVLRDSIKVIIELILCASG